MSTPTKVIFRVFKKGGDVLALFPEEPCDNKGGVMSYQRLGQHSGADYAHCIQATRPATPEEYAPLQKELEGLGHSLVIRRKK